MEKLTSEIILCKCGDLLKVPIGPDVTCPICGVRWARILVEKGKVALIKKAPPPEVPG